MCPNILTAIKSISDFRNNDLNNYFETYPIRVNAVGEKLEYYIMDAICGSFKQSKNEEDIIDRKGVFSYSGGQNNPPDLIISNGDAFEIKKIESLKASLKLNNSFPKDQLYRDDPRITEYCRSRDGGNWKSKEMFYVVGCTLKGKKGKLKYLFFVHGRCYAAEKAVYQEKANRLKANIDEFFESEGWAITHTTELGRLNRMDPLRITNFRIRGMWEIENPIKVFSYRYHFNDKTEFSLAGIMTKEKYDSFPAADRLALEKNSDIMSQTVKIKNPNNPIQLMDAQLISLWW